MRALSCSKWLNPEEFVKLLNEIKEDDSFGWSSYSGQFPCTLYSEKVMRPTSYRISEIPPLRAQTVSHDERMLDLGYIADFFPMLDVLPQWNFSFEMFRSKEKRDSEQAGELWLKIGNSVYGYYASLHVGKKSTAYTKPEELFALQNSFVEASSCDACVHFDQESSQSTLELGAESILFEDFRENIHPEKTDKSLWRLERGSSDSNYKYITIYNLQPENCLSIFEKLRLQLIDVYWEGTLFCALFEKSFSTSVVDELNQKCSPGWLFSYIGAPKQLYNEENIEQLGESENVRVFFVERGSDYFHGTVSRQNGQYQVCLLGTELDPDYQFDFLPSPELFTSYYNV